MCVASGNIPRETILEAREEHPAEIKKIFFSFLLHCGHEAECSGREK